MVGPEAKFSAVEMSTRREKDGIKSEKHATITLHLFRPWEPVSLIFMFA
jgi:hypothetical protein